MKKRFIISLTAIFTTVLLMSSIPIAGKALSAESPWSNGEFGIHMFYTDTFVPAQPSAAWQTIKSPDAPFGNTENVVGWGFYFEKNTKYSLSLNPALYTPSSSWPVWIAANSPLSLFNCVDETVTETQSNGSKYFSVPAGFKGYVAIPLASMNISAGTKITNFGFKTNQIFSEGDVKMGSVFVYGNIDSVNADPIKALSFNPVLRFVVMGDAHFSTANANTVPERFSKTMKSFYELASSHRNHKTVDALVFVGDIVDDRTDESYEQLTRALSANVKAETKVLACLGNHEFFGSISGTDMCGTDKAATQLKKHLNTELDTSVEINGFRFILSSLRNDTKGGLYWNDVENLDWIQEQVSSAANAAPNKPIFAFAHIGFKNTVVESSDNEFFYNANFGSVYDIYKNYSQIVNFCGHTHHALNFDNAIHQRDFTNVVSGHLQSGSAMGKVGTATSQCLLVEADASNAVRIRRYDVLTQKFIGEPWLISNPSDKASFTYTDARALQYEDFTFQPDAAAAVASTSPNSIQLSVPAVTSNPNVCYYRVEIYNGSKLKENNFGSNIWDAAPPTAINAMISGLASDTDYTFYITAVDSFGNESNTLTVQGRTKPAIKTPFTDPTLKINVYDNLDGINDAEILIDFSSYDAEENENVLWCGDGLKSHALIKTGGGKITVVSNPGAWVGAVKLAYGTGFENTAGVKGLGFYIENNLSSSAHITPVFFGDQYILCKPGQSVIAVSRQGEETALSVASGRYITLNAGFKGWLFIPLDSVQNGYTNEDVLPGEFSLKNIGIKFGTGFSADKGSIVYDNFFVYGDVEENNNGLIAIDSAQPDPGLNTADNSAVYALICGLCAAASLCLIGIKCKKQQAI